MANHRFHINAINEIVVASGGVGGHRYDINAWNELVDLVGGTGTFRYDLDALNEICDALGGATGHRYKLDALNEICDAVGATTGHKYEINALNELVDVGIGVAIRLSATSIAENSAAGTTVGTLSVSGDYTGVPTFTLADNDGNRFAKDGNDIEAGATNIDYEAGTTRSISVSVADITPLPAVNPRIITITVTDVDDTAPTITSANSASIAENATLAHTLTANEAVTWTITGGADELQFDISGSTLTWVGDGTQDYETPADDGSNNTYVVQVTATDAATNATNQTITITVTDVSDTLPPSGDVMMDFSINTNSQLLAVLADF